MLNNRLDPLSGNTPIVDKGGVPTLAFQRKWAQQITANTTIPDLSQRKVIAGSGLKGGGDLGADITLSADVQAVLDQLGTGRGSLIYLGDSTWHLLAPGTAAQVLTTGGPGADPSWADAAPTTPALTHGHVFVGNTSNVASDVAMSGDATIADTGALTVTQLHAANGSATAPSAAWGGGAYGYYWDATNSRWSFSVNNTVFGYYVPSPSSGAPVFRLYRTDSSSISFNLEANSTANNQVQVYSATASVSGGYTARRGRGTIAAPAIPQAGDLIGFWRGQLQTTPGSGDGGFTNCCAMNANVAETGTVGPTAVGSNWEWQTCAIGAVTLTTVFHLQNAYQAALGPFKIGAIAAPATSAILDLSSTTGALLIPRMTTTQKNALTAADGMLVYDTSLSAFYKHEAGAWVITGGTPPVGANPTAQVGPAAVNGVSAAFMRSDAAPKLADTTVTPATYGSASTSAQVTIDQQGRVTAASSVAITTGATGDALAARWTAVPASPGFDVNYDPLGQFVFSNSNKTATPVSSSPYNYAYGAPARYTGKRYFEIVPGSTSFCNVGVCGSCGHVLDLTVSVGDLGQFYPGQLGWAASGAVLAHATQGSTDVTVSTVAGWSSGNVLSIAIDIDNALIWFRVGAGNWNNNAGANPATGALGIKCAMIFSGASSTLVWPAVNMGNTAATTLHLLAADFTESVPSGFTGWAN